MSLSKRLKFFRESIGMTQAELAKVTNASIPAWQCYESGKNVPNGKVLTSLASMGLNINWLLMGDENVIAGAAIGGTNTRGIPRSEETEEIVELLEKYGNKAIREEFKARLMRLMDAGK